MPVAIAAKLVTSLTVEPTVTPLPRTARFVTASEPAPVMSFHNRLPAPTPSGATVADTYWKQPALKVSSSGNVETGVSPVF